MKKICLIAVCSVITMLFSAELHSQKPFVNNSFEKWNQSSGLPQSWYTLNIPVPLLGNVSIGDVTRSVDAFEGAYCVQIKPYRPSGMITAALAQLLGADNLDKLTIPTLFSNAEISLSMNDVQSVVSILMDGEADIQDLSMDSLFSFFSGFMGKGLDISDCNSPIESISGHYKLDKKHQEDNVIIAALLMTESDGQRVFAGGGLISPQEQKDGFASFEIPVTYLSDADELIFLALINNMSEDLSFLSVLTLDDIHINYEGVSINLLQDTGMGIIYPNPSVNKTFRIKVSCPQKVEIYNEAGVLVKFIESYIPDTEIQFEQSGLYIVKTSENVFKINVK